MAKNNDGDMQASSARNRNFNQPMTLAEVLEDDIGGEEEERRRMTVSERLMQELATRTDGRAYVAVYRVKKGKQYGSFVVRWAIGEKTVPEIMETCQSLYFDKVAHRRDGTGGDFILVIHDGTEVVAREAFSVDAPADDGSQPNTPANQGDDRMANLLLVLQNQAKEQREADDRRNERELERQRESSNQMMQMMTRLVEVQRPVEQKSSLKELMELMVAMKTLNPEPPKSGGVKELLETITLVDTIRESGGGGDKGIMQTLIEGLKEPLNTIVKAGALKAAVAAPAPAVRVVNPAGPAPAIEKAEGPPPEFIFLMKALCRAAQKDSDPAVYAEFLIDQNEEALLRQLFADEATYDLVLSGIPADIMPPEQVQALKPWFVELRDTVLEYLSNPPAETADAAPGEPTDATEIVDDAQSTDVSGDTEQ